MDLITKIKKLYKNNIGKKKIFLIYQYIYIPAMHATEFFKSGMVEKQITKMLQHTDAVASLLIIIKDRDYPFYKKRFSNDLLHYSEEIS